MTQNPVSTTPIVQPSPLHQIAFTALRSASSPSPEEMNVDTEESAAEAALRVAGLKVLKLKPYQIDSDLSVLVCITCEYAIHQNKAIVHGQTHGIKLTKQHISELNKLIPPLRLANTTKDFPPPPNNQAPIDYIKIEGGIRCHQCDYACRKPSAIESHWSDHHRDIGSPDYTSCKVQSIFAASPNFFIVRPILKGLAPNDPYRLYLAQFESQIATADKSIIPPISENEVPPLLRVTLWHEHLASLTTDKVSVRNVRLMLDTKHAVKETPHLGKPLFETIGAYMSDIKKKMKAVPIPARMLLTSYPV
jgi:hypothetical protein